MPRTLFLSVQDTVKLIQTVGIPEFYRGLLTQLESDYRRWPEFVMAPRSANHSAVGVIELMPTSDADLYSFKYVNGHPQNIQHGLPTVMAFGALAEVATGWPLLLAEMTLLTGVRTATTSAMAAKAVARPDSTTMAMIGCGAQAEFQILAFHHLVGITEVRLFDIDSKAIDKVLSNLSGAPVKLIVATSVAEAVRGADIVTTSTASKQRAAVLDESLLEPGMHLNTIGGDCPGKTELTQGVVASSKVFVEYPPQTRIEGEIQQMPAEFEVTELWKVLSGLASGRDSAEQITLFDSVGYSLEDFSTLVYAHRAANDHSIGSTLDIIPVLDNVKDLFSLLK